jgi:Ca-activated chloride channel homolog
VSLQCARARFSVMFGLICCVAPRVTPQQSKQIPIPDQPFVLRVGVDEVSVAFHVDARRGRSLGELTKGDFVLSDEGRVQDKIASFHSYRELPVRVGFLLDASGSMLDALDENAYIAGLYATQMLRKGQDQAFVMGFGTDLHVTQEWTDNPDLIESGIRALPNLSYGTSGTAIFDSLYTVCRNRWRPDQAQVTGNFVLLFTDGIDNMSHARLEDAIDMCQRTRTAIYIFTNQRNLRGSEQGTRTLEALSSQSGGRIFVNPNPKQIEADIETMDNDQRNQYLLDFTPAGLIRDRSFHRIKLQCKVPGTTVLVRSGYYAIPHRY